MATGGKAGTSQGANDAKSAARTRRHRTNGRTDISSALRSVYDEAAKEQIPSEMLDLLGKLS
ncbi:MAG: NepR family anti-sigma factor [Parasphingopyxis sp.]|uniref:NepR family anti-sigma factor n=1 Tax=Parasphingopyxis sp. TaxID=1920299 RepID=UPI00261561BE|nr:NepR family anti-sigma factor [uncultured Parasphingopyxis sp.]